MGFPGKSIDELVFEMPEESDSVENGENGDADSDDSDDDDEESGIVSTL